MFGLLFWQVLGKGFLSSMGSSRMPASQANAPQSAMVVESVTAPSRVTLGQPAEDGKTFQAPAALTPEQGPQEAVSVTSNKADSVAINAAEWEVTDAVQRWSRAWGNKDVATYLAMYGANFVPPDAKSRPVWESERRQRILGKKKILHTVSKLTVTLDGNKAIAKFQQDYSADQVKLSQMKTLTWILDAGQWQIVAESVAQ